MPCYEARHLATPLVQAFALTLSLGSIILMYLFINLISNKNGFFGSIYYGISTMFLGYADSLANQPVDDLLRFAILSLSFWVVSRSDDIKEIFFNSLIWVLILCSPFLPMIPLCLFYLACRIKISFKKISLEEVVFFRQRARFGVYPANVSELVVFGQLEGCLA